MARDDGSINKASEPAFAPEPESEPDDDWPAKRKQVLDGQSAELAAARENILTMLKNTGPDRDVVLDLGHLSSK
jgi:hypothetical protein